VSKVKYDGWCVKYPDAGFLLSTASYSQRESIKLWSGKDKNYWRNERKRGARCVKVRIVEVGK